MKKFVLSLIGCLAMAGISKAQSAFEVQYSDDEYDWNALYLCSAVPKQVEELARAGLFKEAEKKCQQGEIPALVSTPVFHGSCSREIRPMYHSEMRGQFVCQVHRNQGTALSPDILEAARAALANYLHVETETIAQSYSVDWEYLISAEDDEPVVVKFTGISQMCEVELGSVSHQILKTRCRAIGASNEAIPKNEREGI